MGSRHLSSRILVAASFVILLVDSAMSAQVFLDQRTINPLDWATANLMAEAFQEHGGLHRADTIVFVGLFWQYETSLRTAHMDMNVSPFGKPWSQRPMFEYATGTRLSRPGVKQQNIAQEVCANSPLWPDRNGLTISNGVAIVCLAD
jgi:hypothetical protein